MAFVCVCCGSEPQNEEREFLLTLAEKSAHTVLSHCEQAGLCCEFCI